ncbi:hypothetical protein [Bordetella hinzii]|uniref:hypothetical protein n=1 Tax=Bordetella hinzii TaxID=103855 RepID=UPI001151F815|nr:hypothetical protein [Bordetella hinzii]
MAEATPESKALPVEKLQPVGRLLYCDRIVGVAVGPQVSRLTLGLDSGSRQNPVPEVTDTVVIPTTALLQFIGHTVSVLKNETIFKTMEDQLHGAIDQFHAATRSESSE